MIVEHGYGVHNADSYVSVAYADTYFSTRGVTSWAALTPAVKEASLIKATDYIEKMFGQKFGGSRAHIADENAKNVLILSQLPQANQTITVGSQVITVGTEVDVPETIAGFISDLIAWANGYAYDYFVERGFGTELLFLSDYYGADALRQTCSTTISGALWFFPAFQGGAYSGLSQALSFPRINLYLRDGQCIKGVPDRLKQATCEYAVRASQGELIHDPGATAGGTIKRTFEKIGPLEEEIEYQDGAPANIIAPSYPAVDSMLREYFGSFGGVYA